jgi:hypothetical protein
MLGVRQPSASSGNILPPFLFRGQRHAQAPRKGQKMAEKQAAARPPKPVFHVQNQLLNTVTFAHTTLL